VLVLALVVGAGCLDPATVPEDPFADDPCPDLPRANGSVSCPDTLFVEPAAVLDRGANPTVVLRNPRESPDPMLVDRDRWTLYRRANGSDAWTRVRAGDGDATAVPLAPGADMNWPLAPLGPGLYAFAVPTGEDGTIAVTRFRVRGGGPNRSAT
jgi:hypothetical protein